MDVTRDRGFSEPGAHNLSNLGVKLDQQHALKHHWRLWDEQLGAQTQASRTIRAHRRAPLHYLSNQVYAPSGPSTGRLISEQGEQLNKGSENKGREQREITKDKKGAAKAR